MASKNRTAKSTVKHVQIDGLVVLKIIKHCQEEGAGGADLLVQGVLLGLVVDTRLEITNCFPFPRHAEDEDFDEMSYQMDMMKHMRHVNVDHLHVGWYQSTYFGSFLNKAFVDSQFNYQHSIEESVVLIYDPLRTAKGFLSLKAFRLTPEMMDLYNEGEFLPETVKEMGISFENMFEEIPIVVKNSHLVNALCCEIEDKLPRENTFQFLDLATDTMLEKNVHLLMDCVDDLGQDSNKYFNYQRQAAKQQQAKTQYLQKRQSENTSRAERNEPSLPEEDINKVFKPLLPPSRLDSLLISSQINSYAAQMIDFTTQSFGKLFMAESLQEKMPNSS